MSNYIDWGFINDIIAIILQNYFISYIIMLICKYIVTQNHSQSCMLLTNEIKGRITFCNGGSPNNTKQQQ
jgi:hypothetical protein